MAAPFEMTVWTIEIDLRGVSYERWLILLEIARTNEWTYARDNGTGRFLFTRGLDIGAIARAVDELRDALDTKLRGSPENAHVRVA